ncbi:TetR/AcrR family transcriptional regulator [Nocardia mexicana]|uniref:TetR family transcriptional regulator n=1 Tax=Nocardia mexicana TaxID=279262 RepID=A0A370HDH2_9NOCA|nr:TetR/AcrR family transcriptional regulator C-terminal domain-containing protein [Nocardia mexicana]RDI52923.1 TetR family transcriptional regulator [Nocardia mexicana]
MPTPTALELLWGTQQRPKRGPKPTLTLDRIVTEAIALADAEGLANLSMQRLSEQLGCAKMALYRYVPGKAELTALMLDIGLGRPPKIEAAEADSTQEPWRAQLRAWAETIFERYRAHPWSLELLPGVRPLGPNEMEWMEAALAPLAGTGLTGAERLDTVVLLNGHARSLVHQTARLGYENTEAELARAVGEVVAAHADRYPEVVAAFAESDPTGPDNALDYGIDRILDGVAALIATRAR